MDSQTLLPKPVQLSKPARQNEIDLLRIIAAFAVFGYHYTDSFNYVHNFVPANLPVGRFFRYGSMGVQLFFVVSGYVVTLSARNKTFREFWISRISRLYPAFWLSCITALLLSRVLHIETYMPYPDIKTFLFNLTMVPTVFGKTMLIPVYWSLLEEMHFYLLISMIIAFRWWNSLLTVLICWLSLYVVLGLMGFIGGNDTVGVLVPKQSLYFITGMLFYLLRVGYCSPWKIIVFLSVLFLIIGYYSLQLVKYLNLQYHSSNAVTATGFIVINSAIFLTFFLIARRKVSIAGSKVLAKLGDLTYPFYLFHIFGFGLYWYLRNRVQPQVLLLVMLVTITAFSFLINTCLEKPMMKRLAAFLRRYWAIR